MLLEFFQLLDAKLKKIDNIQALETTIEQLRAKNKSLETNQEELKTALNAMQNEINANAAWQNKFDELAQQLKNNSLNLQ